MHVYTLAPNILYTHTHAYTQAQCTHLQREQNKQNTKAIPINVYFDGYRATWLRGRVKAIIVREKKIVREKIEGWRNPKTCMCIFNQCAVISGLT